MSLADKGYKFVSTTKLKKLAKDAHGGDKRAHRLLSEYIANPNILELPLLRDLTAKEYQYLEDLGLV